MFVDGEVVQPGTKVPLKSGCILNICGVALLWTYPTGFDAKEILTEAKGRDIELETVDVSSKSNAPKPREKLHLIISKAIKESDKGYMSLADIYDYFTAKFSTQYKEWIMGKEWTRSVRSSLSSCNDLVSFPDSSIRLGLGLTDALNGRYWTVKDSETYKKCAAVVLQPENDELKGKRKASSSAEPPSTSSSANVVAGETEHTFGASSTPDSSSNASQKRIRIDEDVKNETDEAE